MNSTSGQVRRHNEITISGKPHFAYLDIAKAIGILMIIFAHINTEGTGLQSILYRNFYSFHIPLFFVISGMTFKQSGQSFKDFALNKAKRLLLPYLLYSIFTFIWYATVELKMPEFSLSSRQTTFGSFLEIFLVRGSDGYLQHNPPLWFVPCFFVTQLIYFGLCKCKKPIKVLLCVILGALGCIFTYDFMPQFFRELPWQLGVAFCAVPFVFIGEMLVKFTKGLDGLRKAVTKVKAVSVISIFVLGAIIVALTWLNAKFLPAEEKPINSDMPPELIQAELDRNGAGDSLVEGLVENDNIRNAKGHVSMGSKYVGNPGIFYLNGVLGTLFVLIISILLEGLLKSRIELHKSWLCWLGERSFAAMAVHYPIKRRMVVLVAQSIKKYNLSEVTGRFTTYTASRLLPSFIAFIFTLAITVVIIAAIDSFLKNIRTPFSKKTDREV